MTGMLFPKQQTAAAIECNRAVFGGGIEGEKIQGGDRRSSASIVSNPEHATAVGIIGGNKYEAAIAVWRIPLHQDNNTGGNP